MASTYREKITMKYYQYQDTVNGSWISTTPEELLFVLLPENKVISYRLEYHIFEIREGKEKS